MSCTERWAAARPPGRAHMPAASSSAVADAGAGGARFPAWAPGRPCPAAIRPANSHLHARADRAPQVGSLVPARAGRGCVSCVHGGEQRLPAGRWAGGRAVPSRPRRRRGHHQAVSETVTPVLLPPFPQPAARARAGGAVGQPGQRHRLPRRGRARRSGLPGRRSPLRAHRRRDGGTGTGRPG